MVYQGFHMLLTLTEKVMSKKITQESIRKFLDGVPFKKQNMEVVLDGRVCYLKLHRNKIAAIEDGELWIRNAGWFSNTTKERLNGLPGVRIQQMKGNWYLNGSRWDGTPTRIGKLTVNS